MNLEPAEYNDTFYFICEPYQDENGECKIDISVMCSNCFGEMEIRGRIYFCPDCEMKVPISIVREAMIEIRNKFNEILSIYKEGTI